MSIISSLSERTVIDYAIIVKNKTRLELLIERFNTKAQAKFYIERSGGDFNEYELEHEVFHASLALIQKSLSTIIKNKLIDRSFLPSFLFNKNQVVLVVGQDGLVANTAKYVNGLPMIAINPDEDRHDGVLMPFTPVTFIDAVSRVRTGQYRVKSVSMAEAVLNDGQRLLAFNDLFIGVSSHSSARYKITYRDKSEDHSSSGIIVSTSSGATGWLSSIFNMVNGIQNFQENKDDLPFQVEIDDNRLMFVVREPFISKTSNASIVMGLLGQQKLVLESYMPSNGVIFSDGVESDFMNFNAGAIATIGIAKEKANLVTI